MPRPDRLEGKYANYFQVGQNATEFVLEFGQFHADETEPLLHTRIITSPSFARGFLDALREAMVEHEERFGPGRED